MNQVYSHDKTYQDIFESLLDLYVRCDLDGNITMCSPSIKKILGYEVEEALGHDINDYYLYNSRTKRLYKRLVREKSIKNFLIELTGKNGNIIPCICNIRLLYNDAGKPCELECICRDITELMQANNQLKEAKEFAEQSLKVKDQFLANMSHEIRTPMNGIIGLMDLLEQTDLSGRQQSYLKTMRHSSELLLKLMNDIIDLTKARSKKIKPAKNNIKVSELIENIVLLYDQEAKKKDLNVSILIEKDVPEYIESDETRLSQILSNLLSNAIKFSYPKGSIRIVVNLERKLRINQILSISVIDQGIGIAKKYHGKLFKSFSQIDDSYSKSYSGAGLGLSITKELVELLGGEINVQSEFGKGSNFNFTFKSKPSVSPETDLKSASDNLSKETTTYKILLVDDNYINRQVAKQILRNAKHEVETAVDGFEALIMVERNEYDIILMDIQLPEMSGVDTMLKIRKMLLDNCPPIIALTAFSSPEERQNFLDQGFNEYLAKPFTAKDILKVIQESGDAKDVKNDSSKEKSHSDVTIHILNQDTINQLIKYSDFETLETSLREFNKDTNKAFKKFKTLLQREDYQQLVELVHNIKGNSGTLGGDDMFETARIIEQNIRKGDFTSLREDLKSLYLKFSTFKEHIKNRLNISLDE